VLVLAGGTGVVPAGPAVGDHDRSAGVLGGFGGVARQGSGDHTGHAEDTGHHPGCALIRHHRPPRYKAGSDSASSSARRRHSAAASLLIACSRLVPATSESTTPATRAASATGSQVPDSAENHRRVRSSVWG